MAVRSGEIEHAHGLSNWPQLAHQKLAHQKLAQIHLFILAAAAEDGHYPKSEVNGSNLTAWSISSAEEGFS